MTLPSDPLNWAVAAFRDNRAELYSEYQQYINGNHPLVLSTEEFQRVFGRRFRNFAYNRCGTVITAHADRQRIAGIGADDDTLNTAAQELWDENQMDVRQGQLAAEKYGMGDAYLLIEIHPRTGDVQMWPQPAAKVRVHYDEERPNELDLAATMWRDEDVHTRVNLYFADRIEKYRTKTRTPSGIPVSAAYFERYTPDSDTAWPVTLPITDIVPIFPLHNHGRVNSYGISELQPVLPIQDALNKTLINQMVAEEFTAYQQRVLLNYDVNDEESQQLLNQLAAGINRILAVPPPVDGAPPASIAEFSATDMSQYDMLAEKWDIRISRQSGLPVHYLTGQNSSVSGRAKMLDEASFIIKITKAQAQDGPVYARALAYGLRIKGTDVEPGKLRINWESAAPLSEMDMWELMEQAVRAGLPFESGLRIIGGFEPDQIEAIKAERDADPMIAAAGF